ncbi:MAG: serine/threonine protein kinase, partial [Nodularia sp. (in: Bacteria)]
DLYGLGATLIHLLTGVAPGELPQNNLRIQFAGHTSLSANFVNWIEKLTEPALEQRFATANEALELLFQKMPSSSSQTFFSRNNPVIHLVRPFLVVTKKSTEELEIYRYKEPVQYKKFLLLIPVFLFFIGGWELLGITGFIILFWSILRWKILDDSTNKEIDVLIKKLFNPDKNVNSINKNNYGGYIRFDAKDKYFVFKNCWFGKFESTSDLITNIRSIYVCQKNENSSKQFSTGANEWQVVIRTYRHRIRLNWRLNEEECGWLVNEIQTWLNQS